MPTDRAHAAEDEYFRNQEADRQREAGWESQACAQASERTASAYARALSLSLADDVRFGVERQSAVLTVECGELRRLRWM